MPFTIKQATIEDARDIASTFLSNGTDHFLRLQLGTVDPAVLREGLTGRLRESIEREGQVYIIARDDESGHVVSYAQWTLPRNEMEFVVEQNPEVIWYRRRGAASALTTWPFERADEEEILVYLDTEEREDAKSMYERLGFKRVSKAILDLSEYGSEGVHTHISMTWRPNSRN